MSAAFRTFWLPRRGNSPEEYEDAFTADEGAGRYALADGATESPFARQWAEMLVEDFVQDDRDPTEWAASLSPLQCRFDDDLRARTLPWYGEAQREQGAFATLLGVVVTTVGKTALRWKAIAVGDCCLFHTRRAKLVRAFPLERADQFSNVPDLVSSRPSPEPSWEKRVVQTEGAAHRGDRLWMMSDALARWCLLQREAGANPFKEMQSLLRANRPRIWPRLARFWPRSEPGSCPAPPPQERFASWIEELRDKRGQNNDDITLVTIDL